MDAKIKNEMREKIQLMLKTLGDMLDQLNALDGVYSSENFTNDSNPPLTSDATTA